jgi:hypothetical protein
MSVTPHLDFLLRWGKEEGLKVKGEEKLLSPFPFNL